MQFLFFVCSGFVFAFLHPSYSHAFISEWACICFNSYITCQFLTACLSDFIVRPDYQISCLAVFMF